MYLRPVTSTDNFFYANGRVAQIRADIHNRRITVTKGFEGSKGVAEVHTFDVRDDAESFLCSLNEKLDTDDVASYGKRADLFTEVEVTKRVHHEID